MISALTSSLRHVRRPNGDLRRRFTLLVSGSALLLTGCNADKLNIPNFNAAATTTTPDIALVQNLASGILIQFRANLPGFYNDAGIFGRESLNYFQTDGRNTTNYLTVAQLDNAGFASGGWAGRFTNMRNAANFITIVDGAGFLTEAQKNAARGYAKTFRALEMMYVLQQRDTIGMPVEIDLVTNKAQPFVSRDSAYKFASNLLDDAATNLSAGGTAFPFSLSSGFAGLNTPGNFLKFNRAVAARYLVYRGSLGCGATCYTAALAALTGSFINSAAGADLRLGAYNVYSTSAGDALNPLSNPNAPDQVAHPSIVADAQLNGTTPDLRLTAKTTTIAVKSPPGSPAPGIPTTVGWKIYPANVTAIPIIRNEELILLRAEANIGLGALAAALTDVNYIRTTSGGLPALGAFADANTALTALLYEKRYSLLWEGSRWVDLRRYGRLTTLPLELPTHFRVKVQPVPQAECLFRATLDAALKGVGCP
jgi:starch-binding outer membrane protein, SusD/RagB family